MKLILKRVSINCHHLDAHLHSCTFTDRQTHGMQLLYQNNKPSCKCTVFVILTRKYSRYFLHTKVSFN